MLEEHSAGIVVFHSEDGVTKYLLLKNDKSKYDLPKGNIESGESELNAAVREAREETGLPDIRLVDGFSERITYFYLRPGGVKVHKSVRYYLGETSRLDVTVSEEHKGFVWATLDEALTITSYDNVKLLLSRADKFRKTLSVGIDRYT
ncbi:MAG TPA: NUDIX domain-containing protein [Conexivisphaerales archaeon]|nr:NUDIX domain-containing protein [Conexivisphaerales archaeon]